MALTEICFPCFLRSSSAQHLADVLVIWVPNKIPQLPREATLEKSMRVGTAKGHCQLLQPQFYDIILEHHEFDANYTHVNFMLKRRKDYRHKHLIPSPGIGQWHSTHTAAQVPSGLTALLCAPPPKQAFFLFLGC
ncbi:hypothetical protein HAX54_023530 [Datura stramonium]|uniref:Uncharacterized protein n=1 Tax=Datura stramonium TaxID=4076 RepID=A0ABS8UYU0_DATST|nr:hypothetical protein [Datura stramonium]